MKWYGHRYEGSVAIENPERTRGMMKMRIPRPVSWELKYIACNTSKGLCEIL